MARRSPAVASLALAVAVTLVLGASVAGFFAVRSYQHATKAEGETVRANNAAKEAGELANQRATALEQVKAEKKNVETEKKNVEVEKKNVEKELANANFVAYAFRLREAQAEIQRGRLDKAEAVLRVCDPKLQGWEHDYLLWQTQRVVWAGGRHTGAVNSVAYSPDGKRIVSGSMDNTVKVWDAAKGQEALSLKGHTGAVTSVAFSPDGKRIVSGSADKTVKGVGRGDGPGGPLPQGAHRRRDQRGVQPRRQTHRQRRARTGR